MEEREGEREKEETSKEGRREGRIGIFVQQHLLLPSG